VLLWGAVVITLARKVMWRPGYFTGQPHAVGGVEPSFVFHGLPLVWSLCGRITSVTDLDATGTPCAACVDLLRDERSSGQT
jgi:hypothetical protein